MNKDCKRRFFRYITQDVVEILRTRGKDTSKKTAPSMYSMASSQRIA